MRFTKQFWDGIAAGKVTVAFRLWKRPTVVVGRPYRTGGGRVEVTAVETIEPDAVADGDVSAAGYGSRSELMEYLNQFDDPGRDLYRVEFRLIDEPDPRQMLAADDDLDVDDVVEIETRLDRLDRASRHGAWTRQTLQLIAAHPETRAPDLAEMAEREAQPFKLDVRKLKNLGLTESLGIGYRLSARGRAFLATLET